MQENTEKAKHAQRQPTVDRMAVSESGNDIIFEVVDADPLHRGNRQSPSFSDSEEAAGATGQAVQQEEEEPEIQQRQEENASATSVKVIGARQPRDEDSAL